MWLTTLSGQLPIIALVGRYPTNKLIGRKPLLRRRPLRATFTLKTAVFRGYEVLLHLSMDYPSPQGRLPAHYSPVCRYPKRLATIHLFHSGCPELPRFQVVRLKGSLDLHA